MTTSARSPGAASSIVSEPGTSVVFGGSGSVATLFDRRVAAGVGVGERVLDLVADRRRVGPAMFVAVFRLVVKSGAKMSIGWRTSRRSGRSLVVLTVTVALRAPFGMAPGTPERAMSKPSMLSSAARAVTLRPSRSLALLKKLVPGDAAVAMRVASRNAASPVAPRSPS